MKKHPYPDLIQLGSPFTKPEVATISDHLSAEPTSFTLPRDGDLPLHFTGWLLGQAEATYSRVDVIDRVFLTTTGKLVVATSGKSKASDNAWDYADVGDSPKAALEAWRSHTKGRLSRCALDAWTQACFSLPFLEAFHRVEV